MEDGEVAVAKAKAKGQEETMGKARGSWGS